MKLKPASRLAIFLICTLIILTSSACLAKVIYVKTTGSDTNDGLSWPTAKKTVQAGINASDSGDEIWVAAGTYAGGIVLKADTGLYGGFTGTEPERSQRDWSENGTALENTGSGSVVQSPSGAAATTVIDGFTIRNGSHGIYCHTSSPTISNNSIVQSKYEGIWCTDSSPVITGNTVSGNGSEGIVCVSSSAVITSNVISGNDRAGIYCQSSSPTVTGNTITGNAQSGILCRFSSSPVISDNIISANSGYSGYGGGVYCEESSPTIENNTISGNTSSSSEGGGIYSVSASPRIVGNTITENTCAGVYLRESSSVTVSGNSIARNTSSGIYCSESDAVTVTDNLITGNNASGGGGIRCYLSSMTISDNTIAGNTASNGAGIYCYSSSPTISGNSITGNNAASSGGGVYCYYLSSPSISNNTIRGNSAGASGGGVCAGGDPIFTSWASTPSMIGNSIVENTAPDGAGVYQGGLVANNVITRNIARRGGGVFTAPRQLVVNNTIVGNVAEQGGGVWTSYTYSDIANCTLANNIVAFNSSGIHNELPSQSVSHNDPTLSHNCVFSNTAYDYSGLIPTSDISADPKFADLMRGDLHIQPGSPCVNTGESNGLASEWLDMDGQPRILPVGGTVDIGADESDGTAYTPQPLPIIRVRTDGDDANDGSSWLLAKQSIQSAIDAASEGGGEVWVKAGTYAPITLKAYAHVYGGFVGAESSRTQRDWRLNLTAINGGGTGSAVTMNGGWMPSTLDGFSITNGSAPSGGGIYLNLAAPTIANCTVSGCAADLGGGIYCGSSGATITACDVVGNAASTDGGGIYDVNSTTSITNNVLRNNSAQRGGGLFVYSNSSVLNNTVVDNQSSLHGGGIFCNNSKATIRNNIVAFNQRGLHVYIAAGGGLTPTVSNNCVYGNTGYDYYGISRPGTDIPMNPAFVNKAGGDFHLHGTSLCIDKGSATGAPSADKDGNLRPQDGNTDGRAYHDIGAYEYPFNLTKAKRQLADNQLFAMIGAPVTAVFGGQVYLEMPDRTSGIRVDTAETLAEGQVVNLSGKIYTDSLTGERYVLANAGYPQQMGSELTLQPFGFSNSVLGGGALGLQGGVWSKQWVRDENDQWQRIWTEAMGLNNIGLLVTTFGSITHAGDGFFYLDDGSALDDGSGHTGVKVQAAGLIFPSEGFAKVTGISSCEKNAEGKTIRVLKVRKQEDIQ